MDLPNKKRTQTTNVGSDATPLSKLRLLSSAATGADQQSAAASSPARPTAMATAVAVPLPIAAPAAAAPPVPAGPAVTAIRRLSPAERCPSDPLSVAFSFLDLRDFAVASRVCRHWHRSAELQSAWPEFNVERLISGLIENDRHWTQSRSVRVNPYHLSAGELQRAAQSTKWRRLAELVLHNDSRRVSLRHVAQLPRLQSLQLIQILVSDAAAAFRPLAPRLMSLRCESFTASDAAAVHLHLHLLTNLRVLSFSQKGKIDGRAVLPLHQLEFLQLRCTYTINRDLLLAIRRLSVQHRLRHLSLTSFSYPALDLEPLVAELSGADSGLAPAALVSIRLRCYLSSVSRSALLSLPSLTRLDWRGYVATGEMIDPQSPLPPSPLQQLHLSFDQSGRGAAELLRHATVRAPELQRLHISPLPPSFGQLIRPLRRLRLLDIAVSEPSSLSSELLQSLIALPLFSELILRQRDGQPITFQLNLDALRRIAESPSWHLIHLTGESDRPQLTLSDDVGARLAERLADFRVQVEWRGRMTTHRLIIRADDSATWRQTEM